MEAAALTELERNVLGVLLDRPGPSSAALRSQVAGCRVVGRRWTGVGFFTDLAVDPATPPSPVDTDAIGGAHAEIEGLSHGAGFVVFVQEGRLRTLEGFAYDEPWPTSIDIFRVVRTA